MTQLNEHTTEPSTGAEAEQAELRAIFERLSKLPRYAIPWDQFVTEWAPMDLEDREDSIDAAERLQGIYDGTQETYSLEEFESRFNL